MQEHTRGGGVVIKVAKRTKTFGVPRFNRICLLVYRARAERPRALPLQRRLTQA